MDDDEYETYSCKTRREAGTEAYQDGKLLNYLDYRICIVTSKPLQEQVLVVTSTTFDTNLSPSPSPFPYIPTPLMTLSLC